MKRIKDYWVLYPNVKSMIFVIITLLFLFELPLFAVNDDIFLHTNNKHEDLCLYHDTNEKTPNSMMLRAGSDSWNIKNSITNHSENIDSLLVKKMLPNYCFLFALDTFVMSGVQAGFGRIHYDSTSVVTEKLVAVHANRFLTIITIGVSGVVNKFRSRKRNGFYTTFNFGLDYTISINAFSGSTERGIIPNISYGAGYSFDLGNQSFLRVSLDAGVKYIIGNLKFSIVF